MRAALPVGVLVALVAAGDARGAEDAAVRAEWRGEAVHVVARATVQAPFELVWSTLTDYDRLREFIPGIHQSRVIERAGRATIVKQSGEARFLVFSYPIDVTVRTVEHPPQRIDVELLSGNLRHLRGGYRIELLGENRLVLHWNGVIEPDVALPPLIGRFLLRRNLEDQFHGMVGEIERRARAAKEPR